MKLKCECGFEFTNQKSASSVSILSKRIDEIMTRKSKNNASRDEKIRNLIAYFAVPYSKEYFIEFLALAASHAKMKGKFFNTMGKRFATVSIIAAVIVFIYVMYVV